MTTTKTERQQVTLHLGFVLKVGDAVKVECDSLNRGKVFAGDNIIAFWDHGFGLKPGDYEVRWLGGTLAVRLNDDRRSDTKAQHFTATGRVTAIFAEDR